MTCESCGKDKDDAMARALNDAGEKSIQVLCQRCSADHDSHRWMKPDYIFAAPIAGKKTFGTFKRI